MGVIPFTRGHAIALCMACIAILAFRLSVKAEYLLGADHAVKYIQGYSLLQNQFKSENIYYPAVELDPEYRFCPVAMLEKNGDAVISPFPIALAIVNAGLIALGGAQAVYWASALTLICFLLIIHRFDRTYFTVTFLILCTALSSISFMFFDVNLYLLLMVLGLSLRTEDEVFPRNMLAGLLCGLSVTFRLEGLLFLSILGFVVTYLAVAQHTTKQARMQALLNLAGQKGNQAFALALAITLSIFFVFNLIDYGHILGPRFMANEEGFLSTVGQHLRNSVVLLLAGNLRLGYFGFTPLFFAGWLSLLASKTVRSFVPPKHKPLVYAGGFFLVLAPLLSPNDGNIDHGSRYLAIAWLPSALVMGALLRRIQQCRKYIRILLLSLVALFATYSFLVQIVILRQTAKYSRMLESQKTAAIPDKVDFVIMQNPMAANYTGYTYLTIPSMIIRNPSELEFAHGKIAANANLRTILFIQVKRPKITNTAMERPRGLMAAIIAFFLEPDQDALKNFNALYLDEATERQYMAALTKGFAVTLHYENENVRVLRLTR